MKKILISLLTLFYLNAFAGEIGYVWLSLVQGDIDDFNLDSNNFFVLHSDEKNITPTKTDIIKIQQKNIIFKNKNELEKAIKTYRNIRKNKENELNCYYFYNFIYNNNDNNKNECNILNKNIDFSILDKNVLAKVLSIQKYIEGIFLEIEILTEFKEEIKKENIIKPIEEETLCDSKENSVFSCETENNKNISICKNINNTMSYKYGTKEKIELEYSSEQGKDINTYFQNYIFYGSHNYSFELKFTKNKYNYIIYKNTSSNGFKNEAGIIIKKNDNRIKEIKCKYPLENNNMYFNIEYFNINNLEHSML